MKQAKKVFTVGVAALALAFTFVPAFAASAYTTPAEAVAGLTGRTTDSVISERMERSKTYGTMAADAGKLDEFKIEVLEMKKDNLASQVEAGTITQEKADAILEAINKKQAVCGGTGSSKIGQVSGVKFGFNGTGRRLNGANRGVGGQGGSRTMNNGVCVYQ